jgi:D-arabinose 1-dehydrogenase-like Zn-dependent alcohol dehydrogenase
MRAVRLTQVGKPLEETEVDLPETGASDVLIRVAASGICHSDEHYRAGISRIDRLPVTLGHEIAGWIEKVGGDIKHVTRGERVCVHYLAHCGTCESVFAARNSFAAPGK